MIITETFVYLHMPKSGGTFVEEVLGKVFAGRERLYLDSATSTGRAVLGGTHHHETITGIPLEHRDKPILFTIRNPFDHYVSHYEFQWWRNYPRSFFKEHQVTQSYPQYPNLSFSEFLEILWNWNFSSTVLESTSKV